jgi:DNA polymerase-1
MKIIIIDGNSLINRAYYAMQRPMITKTGLYTQGVYGFLNMLNKIKNEYKPDYLTVAFDSKAPTFRHNEYADYKAGRKKMPPELAMQIPLLKEILEAMKIKILEMDGYEADDIIGTIAKKAEEEGLDAIIITGDKDELQLATERTKVVTGCFLVRSTLTEMISFESVSYSNHAPRFGMIVVENNLLLDLSIVTL